MSPIYSSRGGRGLVEVVEAFDLGWHRGNALKYLYRAGLEGDPGGDLCNARWFVLRAFEHGESSIPPGTTPLSTIQPLGNIEPVLDEWSLDGPRRSAVSTLLVAGVATHVPEIWRKLLTVVLDAIDEELRRLP